MLKNSLEGRTIFVDHPVAGTLPEPGEPDRICSSETPGYCRASDRTRIRTKNRGGPAINDTSSDRRALERNQIRPRQGFCV